MVLSKQLLQSGTRIGANLEEATAAISKMDLIAKMSIAPKEAGETKYWIGWLNESNLVNPDFKNPLREVEKVIYYSISIIQNF
jgi:four helix bundle protein